MIGLHRSQKKMRVPSRIAELSQPILRFVDEFDLTDQFVTVVVPELVRDKWWHQLLHNQSALVLRTRLRNRPNTIVTSVPFHLDPIAEKPAQGA